MPFAANWTGLPVEVQAMGAEASAHWHRRSLMWEKQPGVRGKVGGSGATSMTLEGSKAHLRRNRCGSGPAVAIFKQERSSGA